MPPASLAPRVVVPPHIDAVAAPALGAVVHRLQGRTMGTMWTVKLAGAPRLDTGALQRRIERELDLVVAQMSTWEPDSDLSRFNRAPAGTWHRLEPAFFDVLACALEVAASSGGAFDPAAGVLVDLWGFGPTGRHDAPGFRPPERQALDTARARGNWQALRIDPATRSVLQPGAVGLDLSAIAKGFGVDQVARCLRGESFDSFLVDVGGELCGAGVRPDGQPWWVALETPLPLDGTRAIVPPPPTRVALHGLCVATSGDYRRGFVHGGRHRPHTIDPRRGEPVSHGLASVSVLHRQCMRADALSTALTVLGPHDGMAYARLHDVAALFVARRADGGFDEQASPALLEMAA